MSSDDQDDDITIVTPHHGEYAASEPGALPLRVKTGKTRLSEVEILQCDAIEHYNVDPMVYLKTPNSRKDMFSRNHYFQVHKMMFQCPPQ